MISVETYRKVSIAWLRQNNYADYKRVMNLYDMWDVAARNKDFHQAYHYMYLLKKIHKQNGIEES
jgi:hypothetical protein